MLNTLLFVIPNITLMNASLQPGDNHLSNKSTAVDSSRLLPVLFNSTKSKSSQCKRGKKKKRNGKKGGS